MCALWHFRLGDRALIRGRAGAERRAANTWSPVLADSEARRRFLFGTRSLICSEKVAALPFGFAFPRAREGGASGQRFRSGGAGAQLWGLFCASRSKPLTEG